MSLKRAAAKIANPVAKEVKKKRFVYDGDVLKTEGEVRKRDGYKAKMPERAENGTLTFHGVKDFYPNLTPKVRFHTFQDFIQGIIFRKYFYFRLN